MAAKLRDRDAIITEEGIIFRVYGYSYSPNAYVCDPEYAPATVYVSNDSRAVRQNKQKKRIYYKFFIDQGLRLVSEKYPQYRVWHAPLRKHLVGVHARQIKETRKPDVKLQKMLAVQPRDGLHRALHQLVQMILERTSLSKKDFGVFGSLLHDFYHPQFSDLDLVLYGGQNVCELRETLDTMYMEQGSLLRNEFETEAAVRDKATRWKFVNYSPKEYVWHQRRKAVYALFKDTKTGRLIKTEFEPVKRWNEIQSDYDSRACIFRKGWINAVAYVTNDCEAPFMPSTYGVEVTKILNGKRAEDIERIVSYVEEFRMQVERDETVIVQGNLELVKTPLRSFHQITLSYGPRYYEQVLKVHEA